MLLIYPLNISNATKRRRRDYYEKLEESNRRCISSAMTAAMMMPTSVFAADETFKIGVIGPMTGDYAQYGTNVYNAAKIAADEDQRERWIQRI